MGFLLSKSMDANFKKQQEFMLHNARLQTSLKRLGLSGPDLPANFETSDVIVPLPLLGYFHPVCERNLLPLNSLPESSDWADVFTETLVITGKDRSPVTNQMERQILMQNQMRERQMAMQIAWSREFLKYFGSFYALAAVGLTLGAVKRKRPGLLAPVVPLSFILAYQADSAYGTLVYRMRGEAESIMASEHDRLDLPHGTPTFDSIEKARRAQSHLASLFEK